MAPTSQLFQGLSSHAYLSTVSTERYKVDFFLLELSADISELGRLLGMNFAPGNSSTKTVIGKHIQRILEWEGRGENSLRDYEYARLKMLLKHLQEINRHRPELLPPFRRAIRKSQSKDIFSGIRFEINITASLIRKGIKFDKTEAPDFTIHTDDDNVFLECGSCRIRGANQLAFAGKVAAVVGQKAKKPYCGSSTALIVDVTNAVYARVKQELDVEPNILRDTARAVVSNTEFGSVLLFLYIMNLHKGRYESNYVRADNSEICPVLAETLDLCYPFGQVVSDHHLFPEEG